MAEQVSDLEVGWGDPHPEPYPYQEEQNRGNNDEDSHGRVIKEGGSIDQQEHTKPEWPRAEPTKPEGLVVRT